MNTRNMTVSTHLLGRCLGSWRFSALWESARPVSQGRSWSRAWPATGRCFGFKLCVVQIWALLRVVFSVRDAPDMLPTLHSCPGESQQVRGDRCAGQRDITVYFPLLIVICCVAVLFQVSDTFWGYQKPKPQILSYCKGIIFHKKYSFW